MTRYSSCIVAKRCLIRYAPADAGLADALVPALEKIGYEVTRQDRRPEPGREHYDAHVAAVRAPELAILIYSRQYARGDQPDYAAQLQHAAD